MNIPQLAYERWFAASTILLSYALGSMPTAYLVAKKLRGIDIREHGSGNVGATNVMRVVGKKAGIFVLIVDFLKGFLPVMLVKWLMPQYPVLHTLIALAAVVGHSKSVFLNFTGGKSAITGLGGIMALSPLPALFVAVLAFTVIKIKHTVSIGTITAAIFAPVIFLLTKQPLEYTVYVTLCCLYIIFLHRANIQRLIKGTENKI